MPLESPSPESLASLLLELERWEATTLSHLEWNRRFLPHYFAAPPAPFHHWLNDQLGKLSNNRGSRLGIIAPRESAKSTWITLAYVLRCAVEAREPYIAILSQVTDQADDLLAPIREELETNLELRHIYPVACRAGTRKSKGGRRGDRLSLDNGVLIRAFGRGAKIRGRRHGQHRPSLFVVDDIQNNQEILSKEVRCKTLSWFKTEVIPAGSNGSNFISVGSALHRDAIAVQAQQLPGWRGRTWPALESWPERMDLWYQWERLLTNLVDEHRLETAAQFFQEHRAEMLRGAVSFWPDFKPVQILMARRAELGPRGFVTEYQGVCQSPEGAEWPAEYFDRGDLWFTDWPPATELIKHVPGQSQTTGNRFVYTVTSIDPSKGGADQPGDYQAHIVLKLDRHGVMWVECDCRREPVPEMVTRAVELAREHRPHCVAVETNQGLDLLLPEFERCAAAKKLLVPLQGVLQTESKVFRIRRLGAYLSRGQIRVRNTTGGRLLVDQLRDFPNGDHDDAPDALELAVRRLELLTSGKR